MHVIIASAPHMKTSGPGSSKSSPLLDPGKASLDSSNLFTIGDHCCKGSEEWGYVDKSAWKKTCKTGKSQSPIDLDISQAVMVNWEPMKFHNYDARGDIVAENNGHTELVQGFQSWTKRPYITGGNLKGRYNLQQFHFHWDGNDRFGSEHTLAGLHYPLEVHFVHIKEGLNETNAHHVAGGVAVVAVQFQIAPKGEALFDLEKVTEATNSSDTKGDVPSYSPGSLLPPDTSTFFRYTGSLTTPPCSEGVIWTILAHPNLVTDTQLRILRRHLREDGSLLIDNWRTVQPMNGRKLYLNKGIVETLVCHYGGDSNVSGAVALRVPCLRKELTAIDAHWPI